MVHVHPRQRAPSKALYACNIFLRKLNVVFEKFWGIGIRALMERFGWEESLLAAGVELLRCGTERKSWLNEWWVAGDRARGGRREALRAW